MTRAAVRPGSALSVGRDAELGALLRLLDPAGPRVCFVYGIAGIGKSTLLARFRDVCSERGVSVRVVDCRSIEPTEEGFLDGLRGAGEPDTSHTDTVSASVLLIDTYEVFRIADPWLRHELLPALGPNVSVVVAGREPPMLEWAIERGQIGGLEVLPLGPLDDSSVALFLRAAGVSDADESRRLARLCRGHPLALRLAVEARLSDGALPVASSMPQVVHALAGSFRQGLDEPLRRILDAAAVPRRITRGVLAAMLGEEADTALERLSGLAVVEATADGLRLHDAVQMAIVERLRAVDPERFRGYRTAAWHHLQAESRAVSRHELGRSTADLLFLIDNPVVREAMFPTTAHAHSVEPSRPDDADALRNLWHGLEAPAAAAVLDRWLALAPRTVRVIRDRSGSLVGCSVVATWRDIPHALERDDPVTAGWARHASHHPLLSGRTTIVLRRVLTVEAGEGPCSAQAAAWLDVKREYFSLRPHLGRVYTTLADPTPFIDALIVLGFETFGPALIGPDAFHLAALDFGPDSVDGWLTRLAAAELAIAQHSFLDPKNRTVDLDGQSVQLSPLEYGALDVLHCARGNAVTRVELLDRVWGCGYDGGSNVVDVVIRTLRRKLGVHACRVETVRGVGYRFR